MWRAACFAALTGILALLAPAQSNLRVDTIILSQNEDGVALPSDFEFVPGDTIFLSCRVTGFTRNAGTVLLSYRIEVHDPMGVPVVAPGDGKIAEHLSAEDKQWAPKIRYEIPVPPSAPEGDYHISIAVTDEFGHTQTEVARSFNVRGANIAPSETLTVRNFHFYRGEDEAQPLAVAAYRPGDTLWARFFITGYKFGPKNRFDVSYGIQVLRSNGDIAYQMPDAASEQHDSFYPQRYTSGSLSLNLANVEKGSYSLVLTVRDNIGGQQTELRQGFDVE